MTGAGFVVGNEQTVPTADGEVRRFVNLDNAATTPASAAAVEAIGVLLPMVGSVHRGGGLKSRLTTAAYEQARMTVGSFVGADPELDAVIFGKNTTEAVNLLAHRLTVEPSQVVVTTVAEHHSMLLPWRGRASVIHIGLARDGTIDEDELASVLRANAGRVALLAVTGASNVTGIVPPVHRFAAMAHEVGAPILVDAAQLAPHRPIDMRPHDDPHHLDYVAMSGHKLYAPFGTGVLIGPRASFDGPPHYQGGGTVHAVTLDDASWLDPPHRDEAGTPNVLGAVALAASLNALRAYGLDRIADHERQLTRRLYDLVDAVPDVVVYGPDPDAVDRVALVPFAVEGIDHRLVTARLGYEHAVAVRSGCFCAQPYLATLLGIVPADLEAWSLRLNTTAPGLVRASLGSYSTNEDVDRLVDGLRVITSTPPSQPYALDEEQMFIPRASPDPGPIGQADSGTDPRCSHETERTATC